MKSTLKSSSSVSQLMRFTMLAFLIALYLTETVARKFDQETKNKALKNTRRVQQNYGSSRQIYWNFGNYFWRLDMTPPGLEIGWEFIQSTPTISRGITFTGALPATEADMQAYMLRIRLRAKAAVHIQSSFNIDGLLYNQLTFDLDQFLSYIFGDIILVYQDQTVSTAETGSTPLLIPPWIYNYPAICWAYGYSYNDITMTGEALFKFPQCAKTVIKSLEDWSQWFKILTNFGNNPYLFGLLDTCTMSSDAPTVTFWSYNPVVGDSGDVYLSNDIQSTPGAGNPAVLNKWYYNTPTTPGVSTSCIIL